MRALAPVGALVVALAAAGCGNGSSSSSSASVLSASFGNLAGANTSGVGISTPTVACAVAPTVSMVCKAYEVPGNQGREVDVSVSGVVAAGMDYRVGTSGMNSASVTFFDPTSFGTASGLRQWSALDGTGIVHIDAWDGSRIAFTYGASMQALGSPATGSFDVSGAGNVSGVQIVQ